MAAAIETKLYVTNFPSSATRQQLQQFFSRFGRVQECAIMWNSYAFVHYASMDEARRALDQSNGAMFLNRKLIVQLSTSRFRPQPKEANHFGSKPLITGDVSPSSLAYHHLTHGGGSPMTLQQQSNVLTQQYPNELNFDALSNFNLQHSSSLSGGSQYFSTTAPRPPSPFHVSSQEINAGYYSPYSTIPMDRMTPSPLSIQSNNVNSMMKNIKTDMSAHSELPKLYCTNLPDNCKANDLQRLFSPFGHVIDCVILWDYYAFVTFQNFAEAERALLALHGYNWQDRRLIVEWSRASGRRQQQQTSPSPPTSGFGSFASTLSTPSSPCARPSTLISASNGQFYGNNSPKLLSPIKSQSPHHHSLAMMSMMPPTGLHHHHGAMPPYGNYLKRNGLENESQPIFDSLTNSSLDLSPFMDGPTSNSDSLFLPPSDLTSPSSQGSTNNVYQLSDIVALLEPPVNHGAQRRKSAENSIGNDITNTFPSSTAAAAAAGTNLQTSCSTAAAAAASALLQENVLSSLFDSFEPFSKLFPGGDESSSTSRYNSILNGSPLLTTAPDHSHHPIYYGHTNSWH